MVLLNFVILQESQQLLPPNENYFLQSTDIRSRSKMPATSKEEFFVAIAINFCYTDRVRF